MDNAMGQRGWSYPEGTIVGQIFYVPLEEHLFFILQPIFLILLHSIVAHSQLIPFRIPGLSEVTFYPAKPSGRETGEKGDGAYRPPADHGKVQTLPRGTVGPAIWAGLTVAGGVLVHEAHGLSVLPIHLGVGRHAFYLGWILIWVSPVCAFLSYLGAQFGRAEVISLGLGTAWLWIIDTVALRNQAWTISTETTLGIDVWKGLPLEEAVFFLLVSFLLIQTSSILSHLHTVLLLSPEFPPCPPLNIPAHIILLGKAGFNPTPVDVGLLYGLQLAEDTLKKGSKSFEVAKLAFGREMRIGLVAVYAWCRVTDDLIDNAPTNPGEGLEKGAILNVIRQHLHAAFDGAELIALDRILSPIPDLTPEVRSAFHIFATLIPRLSPVEPFLELCKGYETDLKFLSIPETEAASGQDTLRLKMADKEFVVEDHLPIKTQEDLLQYADDVAGSIAAAICYLAWSVLDYPSSGNPTRPVENLPWAPDLHANSLSTSTLSPADQTRISTVRSARTMGRALQLVNIARDVAKDAMIARVYVPLSSFPSTSSLHSVLLPDSSSTRPDYSKYNLPLLASADEMRESSAGAIAHLPPTAQGGARAMAASYFEIGTAIRREGGNVDARGVKVEKKKRLKAAARAMWGFS